MESWAGHEVPRLPGTGEPLRLYDSARQGVQPSRPEGSATMYVCGITPYDATHLGHAATMITFDLVQRMWRDAGLTVRYVQNVTDIDDPLLERAERDGEDWKVLAMRETALFREDMEALRIIPPEHYVGAVESIPDIAEKVLVLLKDGAAYRLDDGTGDVYFDISAAPAFGYESNLSRDEMLEIFPERGGDPDRAGKRDRLDPLLWRGARESEPSWPGGELGPGRPGWHIECAVIALNLLGDRISVQGGGNDLLFPHHECSAAHAERLTGEAPFADHYVHAGMIGLDGEKMSKSRGNLVFVSRLRADRVDPMAVRLALMSGHYRTDRSWTHELLATAEDRLARWRRAAAAPAGPAGDELLAGVRARLADDLDTAGAIAVADAWADQALAGVADDAGAPRLFADTVDALLGIRL
ncbi:MULTISPECIES: cysteine--1-D-myo-inosityl 2-amino-2-deoxy-alpha-D-glucopyranoside ligase [Micromonospora]|uniref:L-cysteine:1D-myo-inositol 2-amino-2-deoxy-alpha-D-glucopyranoside ligase n=1 Tax=Micromonospora solifontis TaxID=2487138 RepID=A0ABX9W9F2_9ACTN|nr:MULTISPECIES: cysteine--1-D-myo-inosityl 2-amino-2-deoxy-alpha-D-glucopyranoside ligase [Micromonospora]NES13094.1 cysteine--1-D-myo-inosityl 2-amino-2-deoxy-alpha-D-glucopyranoside ligase [Micromonospora sp. PPF5-17B]NES39360.1 cysteine--1-D-myo-inosityl 2-amino-2-deoxy-alpha-D-glucopyranoside ligase [Micromonospora solifontis]NES55019.1 cysteine--1-D-myo-inosityl 2-amino-2-deoxy-alpha-D-glucopyranoside ligase [Micromonospora sp. PPF5-6]RNL89309.1 cysteine--1-D-myo-inosityl 2-amino-2-deoxy-